MIAELQRLVRRVARARRGPGGREGGEHPKVLELRAAEELRAALDALQQSVVEDLRASGATWQDIGDFLGIRRQSAHIRFRRREGDAR